MNDCIAALDGQLCHIRVPSTIEVKKVKTFFLVHKQCYGLNVQATYDVSCHFTSLSVLCPGDTPNCKAFHASQFYNSVEELPDGYFVVVDNAYSLSTTLPIPFSGKDKQNSSKDAYYIEQAFGLLVSLL
jgi:hypothetical protein